MVEVDLRVCSHLKEELAWATDNIKHEARGRDANKARGELECFISIEAASRVLSSVMFSLSH